MSLTAFYDNSTDLVAAYGLAPSTVQLPQRAENGEAAFGLLPFEDPAAGLTLTGHRPIWVSETECTQPRLFTGWVVSREFGRSLADGLIVADDRLSGVNIVDASAGANFIIISGTDGNRPEESWNARLAWLVASDYLAPFIGGDTTYFGSYTQTMDAADYRGSYAASVLDDLKERTGGVLNWFLFWNPDTSSVELFIKREQYTIGTCALRISNVLTDIDNSVTFGADTMAKLMREPDLTYSEVIIQYGDGKQLYRSREATATTYTKRGTTISRPYTKSATTAAAQADQWLTAHSYERDRITCVMRSVPADSVGLVRAGMGINVKFSHMPGYAADYVTMRIVMCSPVPVSDVGDLYDISLELLGSAPEAESVPLQGSLVKHHAGFYGCAGVTEYWPDGHEKVGWERTLEIAETPPGFESDPLTGAVEYLDYAGDYGFCKYLGFKLTDDATVTLDVAGGYGGVSGLSATITVSMRQNGTVIWQEAIDPVIPGDAWFIDHVESDITGLNGDEFSISVDFTGWAGFEFFATTPGEVFDLTHFRITGASGPGEGDTVTELPPVPGTEIVSETPTPTPSGELATFTTGGPYLAGTLVVSVDGIIIPASEVTETDPQAGEFTLSWAPDADEKIRCTYTAG